MCGRCVLEIEDTLTPKSIKMHKYNLHIHWTKIEESKQKRNAINDNTDWNGSLSSPLDDG